MNPSGRANPVSRLDPLLSLEVVFRKLLATGKPVAIEDAGKIVETPEGYDRRSFGSVARKLLRNGEIVEHGYRRATSSRCNSGMTRLWVLANKREGQSRG